MVKDGCHIWHMVNKCTEKHEGAQYKNNTIHNAVNIFNEEMVNMYCKPVFISLFSINLSLYTQI